MLPIMLASMLRVDGLFRLVGIAHRTLNQKIEDRQRDIDEQQARYGLVDAAILAQRPRQHDPQSAADHAGACHADLHQKRRRGGHGKRRAGRGQRAHQQG